MLHSFASLFMNSARSLLYAGDLKSSNPLFGKVTPKHSTNCHHHLKYSQSTQDTMTTTKRESVAGRVGTAESICWAPLEDPRKATVSPLAPQSGTPWEAVLPLSRSRDFHPRVVPAISIVPQILSKHRGCAVRDPLHCGIVTSHMCGHRQRNHKE